MLDDIDPLALASIFCDLIQNPKSRKAKLIEKNPRNLTMRMISCKIEICEGEAGKFGSLDSIK